MQKSKQWLKALGLVSLAGALALSGCKNEGGATGGGTAESSETIPLGLYTSITGSGATYGKNTEAGIRMAIDEVNAKGGILGKQVTLQVEDNNGKPDQSATAVQKLISSDKVLVVMGDFMSSNTLAAAPICQNAKVPLVSPSATNAEVTKKGDYVFRTCFVDSIQGVVDARFAKEHIKAKTAALLIDNKSDHSRGIAKFFEDEFKKDGKIVSTVYYTGGDADFRPQLTNIKGKNPDVIYMPAYYTDAGAIAKQARELGLKQALLGSDAWDSPMLVKIGGKAIEGGYFSTHYSPDSTDPRVKEFVANFKKINNGEAPDSLAATAYDAAKIVLASIEKAGATSVTEENRKKVRDALATTTDFPGVTGDITIDKDRNVTKPLVLVQVKDGKFAYVSTVKP